MIHKRFELDIIIACTCKCNNCGRACGLAPSKLRLSVDDIKRFIKEANELNYVFDFVAILGGEPTLHPDLIEICELLYHGLNYLGGRRRVIVKTNGYTQKTKEVMATLPPHIEIENSNKTDESPLFSKYNDAPIDYPEHQNDNFEAGCNISESCGYGFHPNGKFYCCGAGATIDRIFNLGMGVEHLKDLTEEKLREQKKTLCKYCGHFKDWGKWNEYSTEQVTSKSWEEAFKKLREND